MNAARLSTNPGGCGEVDGYLCGRGRGRAKPEILYLILEYGVQSDHLLVGPSEAEVSVCSFFPPRVATPDGVRWFAGDGTILGFFRALRRAHAVGAFDVVHAHSPHVAFLLLVFNLVTMRGMQGTVFTAHHSYTNTNLRLRNRLLELPIFATFHRIVCVSGASRASFPGPYIRLGAGRIRVIPNSVDLDRVDAQVPDPHSSSTSDQFTVISVGRLTEIKDPLLVLQAFASTHPGDRDELVFIGEGELEDMMVKEINRQGLQGSVRLTGLLPRNDVYDAMHRADLFVSASRGEGLPVALLEAMAARCPVLVTDIPPHREVLDGVEGARLEPVGDLLAFRTAIQEIRNLTPDRRDELGQECRRVVARRYDRSTAILRHLEMYDGITEVS